MTQTCRINLRSPAHGGSTKKLALIGPAVLEMFENIDRWMMDYGQMVEHAYAINSPMSIRFNELKVQYFFS